MKRTILFIVMIIAGVLIAFLYLNNRPAEIPDSLENANKAERCAEYRQTIEDEKDDIYSLGYKGRVRQLLEGCF